MGLTICKTLTELMGGEIGVKSKLGEGAEFYSVIPFDPSDKQDEQNRDIDLSDLRVLLINNNRTELTLLQQYLEHWEIATETGDNLQGVIKRCQTALDDGTPYDVVVLGPQWAQNEVIAIADSAKEAGLKTRFVFLVHDKQQRAHKGVNKGTFVNVDPLCRAGFISAVTVAVGRESPDVHHEEEVEDLKSAGQVLSVEEARQQGTLILVAEDNEVNRDVIGRQLSLLGYTCEMAEDGKLALEAWRSNTYGILLTDCNMPNMDGFELTNSIRRDEEGTDSHSTIIAITANALHGEAERCLESGMDDYMTKPIDMKELREKLHKWMPQVKTETARNKSHKEDTAATEDTTPVNKETSNGSIDERALKDIFGDDPETFKEILVDFVQPSQIIIKEIQAGWKEQSAEAVNQAAHKLKSSARSVGATELADVCQSIETAGKEEDWGTIDSGVPNLDKLMEAVENYINGL